MNILILSTHLNTGGITSYLLTLARGLIKRGHCVWVVASSGNMVESFESSGVKVSCLNIRTKSELDYRIYSALIPILRIMTRNKMDVIHANTRITQVMSACLHRLTGTPYVTTCHGFFKRRLSRRIFPCWGHKVIAISEAVQEHLMKDFKVDQKKVVLVRNGIDLENFPLPGLKEKRMNRRAFGLDNEPVIGIIARLSPVKGQDILIEAMKKVVVHFPKAKLLIVGEGDSQKKLQQMVESLKLLDNIRFYSIVNRSWDMLSLFSVFVMPSRQEGLGLAVMEAQAVGLPVVASKVGGLSSLIEDGKTGLLVPTENPNLLAEAILLFLRNSKQAHEMGKRAREFISKEFSSDRMVDQTIDLYRKL